MEIEAARTGTPAATLDVRGMEAPQHILLILKKASELPDKASMEVLLDNNPFQLYDLLQQRGFFLEATRQPDGSFRGWLRPRDRAALSH